MGYNYVVGRGAKARERGVVTHIYIDIVITRFEKCGKAFFGELAAGALLLPLFGAVRFFVEGVELFLYFCGVVIGGIDVSVLTEQSSFLTVSANYYDIAAFGVSGDFIVGIDIVSHVFVDVAVDVIKVFVFAVAGRGFFNRVARCALVFIPTDGCGAAVDRKVIVGYGSAVVLFFTFTSC